MRLGCRKSLEKLKIFHKKKEHIRFVKNSIPKGVYTVNRTSNPQVATFHGVHTHFALQIFMDSIFSSLTAVLAEDMDFGRCFVRTSVPGTRAS